MASRRQDPGSLRLPADLLGALDKPSPMAMSRPEGGGSFVQGSAPGSAQAAGDLSVQTIPPGLSAGLKSGAKSRPRAAGAPGGLGGGKKIDKKKKKRFVAAFKAYFSHFLPAWCQPKKMDRKAKKPETRWQKFIKARAAPPTPCLRMTGSQAPVCSKRGPAASTYVESDVT